MNSDSFNLLCDDLYLDMYINTELELPTERDTILAFFERIRKKYSSMGCFYKRENNEFCLEEDRERSQYRWVCLETDRIGSGVVNPSEFEMAYEQDRLVLDLIPYMLSVSSLDIDSLDVTFAMDFDCSDNHDEVIAEALLSQSSFNCVLDLPGAKPIGVSPTIVVALSSDELTQARISIESKTGVYCPKKKEQTIDEAISLSCTIRQYPETFEKFDLIKSFNHQCRIAEELMIEKIIPGIVLPLTETIAQKRLT
ncbi:MAG: hypothetical protein JW787_01805 [Sedimentisphaerales bacterium]|nr:hypothetical protein [Sedimentisphaerales bacterium]